MGWGVQLREACILEFSPARDLERNASRCRGNKPCPTRLAALRVSACVGRQRSSGTTLQCGSTSVTQPAGSSRRPDSPHPYAGVCLRPSQLLSLEQRVSQAVRGGEPCLSSAWHIGAPALAGATACQHGKLREQAGMWDLNALSQF